jgi:uncharacterized membrane protein
MDTSIFLARLLGPVFVVLAIGLLLRQDSWRTMARDFISSRPLVFLSGFLTLLGGLALVNTHNVWEAGWPVIITIFGWLAAIGGMARMLFPETVMGVGQKMLDNKTYLTSAGVVEGLLGLWLCYVGYLA